MSTISDFIESLPSDIRPWAKLWTPVLIRLGHAQLRVWLDSEGDDWLANYVDIVGHMTTDEKLAELRLSRAAWAELNNNNSAFITKQKQLAYAVLAKALQGLGV